MGNEVAADNEESMMEEGGGVLGIFRNAMVSSGMSGMSGMACRRAFFLAVIRSSTVMASFTVCGAWNSGARRNAARLLDWV